VSVSSADNTEDGAGEGAAASVSDIHVDVELPRFPEQWFRRDEVRIASVCIQFYLQHLQ